jgi:LysM repeat protein
MKRYVYKTLYYFLKTLIYLKRFLVWSIQQLGVGGGKLLDIYQNTLGIHVYKLWFYFKKKFNFKIPRDSRAVEFFGSRGTLQVVIFIIAIVVMVPHSKLYTRDSFTVAGRDTVLYKIVGPGDQDFDELEEIVADLSSPKIETRSWREGAVVSDSPATAGNETFVLQQEISSISAGGTAITKPTIIPGAVLPTSDNTTVFSGRTEVTNHKVESGEVIGQIAEKYGISVATILWANNLSSRSIIRPGDELAILPTTGVLHKVKSGETISRIARKYDTDSDKIIKFNKLKNDGSDIVIGEKLIIPEGVQPRTAVRSYKPTKTPFSNKVAPAPSVNSPAGSGYLWPSSVTYISQYYGWRHTGLDIAGPIGSPLYATKAGTVIKSQCGWNGGYGCYVIVDHGGGVQSVYAHASQLYVSYGEKVARGQTVALMGSTGRSTGPHIHFEIRVNGRRMNPLQYIR